MPINIKLFAIALYNRPDSMQGMGHAIWASFLQYDSIIYYDKGRNLRVPEVGRCFEALSPAEAQESQGRILWMPEVYNHGRILAYTKAKVLKARNRGSILYVRFRKNGSEHDHMYISGDMMRISDHSRLERLVRKYGLGMARLPKHL
jgi:hypothetical protein